MLCSLSTITLNTSCRPGLGVLGQNGKYWYPARLIERLQDGSFVIRWWRECKFSQTIPSLGIPGQVATLAKMSVVDHLWQDHQRRRQIRVSLSTKLSVP